MIPKVKVDIREPGNGLDGGRICLADSEGRIDVALLAVRSKSYMEFHRIKRATVVAAAGTVLFGGAWKIFRHLSRQRNEKKVAAAAGKNA